MRHDKIRKNPKIRINIIFKKILFTNLAETLLRVKMTLTQFYSEPNQGALHPS